MFRPDKLITYCNAMIPAECCNDTFIDINHEAGPGKIINKTMCPLLQVQAFWDHIGRRLNLIMIQGDFFSLTGTPPKNSKYGKPSYSRIN